MANTVLGHHFFISSPIPSILEPPECSNSMLATGNQQDHQMSISLSPSPPEKLGVTATFFSSFTNTSCINTAYTNTPYTIDDEDAVLRFFFCGICIPPKTPYVRHMPVTHMPAAHLSAVHLQAQQVIDASKSLT